MRKIWLDSYPAGIPPEVDVRAYPSLKHMLEHSCERFRDKPAFLNMGVTMTYGELDRLSRDFGAYLQKELGLQKGDRVAVMLPNLLQYPVALFGALRAGLTVVNVNPLYTASELEQQLGDSDAKAIVVLENFAHTLEGALPKTRLRHVITTQIGDLFPPARRWLVNLAVKYVKRMVPRWRIDDTTGFRRALARGARRELSETSLDPDDIAFLQYTGGTTGRPKGAILTHGNMVANVEQTAVWIGITLKEGEETVVTALPLYHIFALTANLLVFLKLGGSNVLITNPRDIPGFVAELKKTRFTAITGVNTLFSVLLDAPGFAEVCAVNRGALKVAVAGGMAVQRAVAERWQQATGVPLIEGYGLTEASPIVCGNPFDAKEFSGKLGVPVPSTEVAILNEDGDEVPLGELGEICVRGPQVMRSYWNAPEETAKVLLPNGWLRTGDIGRMDARGFVEFSDRRKDVIVVSGFKAYPTEIEDVAMLHPGVKDAGAVGVPDERSGEAVMLFVVRKDPGLTAKALLEHCAKHLTGYKLPRRIEFREQLPKTPIGKILRRQLKDEAAHSHG
ncbi:MAG: long-chain-fatty-acid--CoA ligase [Betaproteobacteria bacterium RIFCSPLOWO2_12_FULL_62_58]|nr:MAG: long-chain-fatty-acid--CoA ligase [Betaproteobacteria bacterium RIFCSPLOWO2_12_FULL_62_58]